VVQPVKILRYEAVHPSSRLLVRPFLELAIQLAFSESLAGFVGPVCPRNETRWDLEFFTFYSIGIIRNFVVKIGRSR
jgi:hypothetical protein